MGRIIASPVTEFVDTSVTSWSVSIPLCKGTEEFGDDAALEAESSRLHFGGVRSPFSQCNHLFGQSSSVARLWESCLDLFMLQK